MTIDSGLQNHVLCLLQDVWNCNYCAHSKYHIALDNLLKSINRYENDRKDLENFAKRIKGKIWRILKERLNYIIWKIAFTLLNDLQMSDISIHTNT